MNCDSAAAKIEQRRCPVHIDPDASFADVQFFFLIEASCTIGFHPDRAEKR